MTTKLADGWRAEHSSRWGWCVKVDGKYVAWHMRSEKEARLVASAPAMYAALVELNTELNLDALANHFPVAEAVVGKIKAAIRAAVGEKEENTQ